MISSSRNQPCQVRPESDRLVFVASVAFGFEVEESSDDTEKDDRSRLKRVVDVIRAKAKNFFFASSQTLYLLLPRLTDGTARIYSQRERERSLNIPTTLGRGQDWHTRQ